MSDAEPDVRTFWFKCPRGHVEERVMPGEGDPPLLCAADVVKSHEAPGAGIYRDLCGEELRHFGPTVAEWRATNEALHEAKRQTCTGAAHLERLLVEADAALAECSAQLDAALTSAQTTRAREAEAEVRRLRDEVENATAAAMLNRDAAQREASAVHERDVARAEASRQTLQLHGLREAALAEAERLDDKRRHKAANRLREAVTDSWGGNAPGLCAPAGSIVPDDWLCSGFGLPRMEAPRGAIRFATDPHPTEPLTLDSQARRISDLTRELADAQAELRRRRSASQGFTVVRDVNQQTEAALKRAEAALRDAQHEERGARQEVCHWRMVALWCAEREAMTDLPQASFQQRSEVLSDRYEAEMEADQ